MKGAKSSRVPMLATAAAGVLPALVAAYVSPSRWTYLAAAGVFIAIATFFTGYARGVRELQTLERTERRLQSEATMAEARIAALETKMRETASHDEVTGVLNRRTFLTRLDEAIQRDARLRQSMAVLLIDIDGFKKINTEAGRLVGDRVLRTVGRAIQASTRGTDIVGRLGGDEFAVLLAECVDPRPAVDRVFVALHGETTGGDKPFPIGVSVGVVTIDDPRLGVDPVELFRVAEATLASVRDAGGGRCGKRAYRLPEPRPVVTT